MKLYSQEEQNAIDKALREDIAAHDIGEKEETETLEEEVRLQKQKLKDMTTKEKASYYVYYYKWHALAAVVVVALVIYLVTSVLSRKDEAFYCVFMNVDHAFVETTELSADFEAYAGINSKKYKSVFDTTIYTKNDNPMFAEDAYDSTMRLSAMFMANQVDVLCSDTATLDGYVAEDSLKDLHEYFTDEELDKLSQNGLIYTAKGADGKDFPAAVRITDSDKLKSVGIYDDSSVVYAAVVGNAPHGEYFRTFISYLYSGITEN